MKDDNKQQRLEQTKSAATAFVEDMAYFKELLERLKVAEKPGRLTAEIRRISALLRRLLIEGDITNIAAPRIGKIEIQAPDNRPIYKMNDTAPLTVFVSGGISIFNLMTGGIIIDTHGREMPDDFHAENTVNLSLNNFVKQRVQCLQGKWVTRGDLIKYCANKNSGVHSEISGNEIDIIARLRSVFCFSFKNEKPNIDFYQRNLTHNSKFRYNPDNVDALLLDMLSTIFYLVNSPDLKILEATITEEIGIEL